MNVLTLIQDTCRELKLPVPSSVYSSTDREIQLLMSLLNLEGAELRARYVWPVLNKEYTFNTVAGVSAYALPTDFDFECFNTQWDRTSHWQLRGPLDAQTWQARKSGIVTVLPRFGFRVKGASSTPLNLEPVPTAVRQLVFEYQSTNWLRPAANWTTATAFAAGAYCAYNGNVYQTTAGGTTGATPPTHNTGSVSDGVVTWTFTTYDRVLADTDVLILPPQILKAGMKWRWKRENGMEWQTYLTEAEDSARLAIQSGRSAPDVAIAPRRGTALITMYSVPDGGFG